MEPGLHARFDQEVMPHLDAAYTLARWLLRDDHDAEDVVQDALLKGLRFAGDFQDGHARAWLLAIVRNTAFTWLQRHRPAELEPLGDGEGAPAGVPGPGPGPEEALIGAERRAALHRALERLPYALREALVLREMQGLSYQAIAEITQAPLGTVMSRLSRARARLDSALSPLMAKES
jgi:RNA polymerase sigma-70 factor (ECF subfamily)